MPAIILFIGRALSVLSSRRYRFIADLELDNHFATSLLFLARMRVYGMRVSLAKLCMWNICTFIRIIFFAKNSDSDGAQMKK